METDRLKRINELSHKAKTTEGLTPEEKAEQARLRQEYLAAFRANLATQLDNTYLVFPDGSRKKLEPKSHPEGKKPSSITPPDSASQTGPGENPKRRPDG